MEAEPPTAARFPRVDPILAVALFALVLRLGARLLAGLGGQVSYDEGVYFSTAALLGRGHVLYRDLASIHPPGMFLLYAPLTWLGPPSVAIVVCRLVACGLGAFSTWLVGDTVRRHRSLRAGVAAALVYAVVPQAIAIERTVFIEPVLNVMTLLAARAWLLAPDGRAHRVVEGRRSGAVATGWWWGVALYCKLTVVMLAVPIAATAMLRRKPTRALVAGSVGVGVLALGLVPVLLGAARPLYEQVFLVQLVRSDASELHERIQWVLGFGTDRAALRALFGTAVALVGFVTLGAGLRRKEVDELLVFGLAWFGGVVVMLLVSDIYYLHYSALLAPPLGLIAGGVGARFLDRTSPARNRVLQVAAGAAVVASAAMMLVFRAPTYNADLAGPEEQAAIAAAVGRHRGCLWTWNPAWLVISDRLPDIALFGRAATEPWLTDAAYAYVHGEPDVGDGGYRTPSRIALTRCPYVLARVSFWPELARTHRQVVPTVAEGPQIWERLTSEGDGP